MLVPLLMVASALALPPDPSLALSPEAAKVAVENPPLFPLAQIKPGMKGTGYTVFSSREGPRPFSFEVLGVMRGFLGPGEDLIIARLSGAQIEHTGVIAGMSGSPAYIDGKLVGAVGYRFGAFTKEPIAGITPIERMLASQDGASPPSPPSARAPGASSMSQYGVATPIATPISVSGMSPHVLEAFRPELEKRGYGPVAATGGAVGSVQAGAGDKPMRLFAGGPIAGNLVDGDVLMSGIGTVTWVKGDRFLAFGHPFLGIGKTEMPVANAEILTTVASEAGSWKMGQARATIGALTDDRLHAIAGVVGVTPNTVPMRVRIDMQGALSAKDAKRDLSFRITQHPTDTPMFSALALANALGNRIGNEQHGGTVDATVNVKMSTGDTIAFPLRAADDDIAFDLPVAIGTLSVLSALTDQPFADVRLASIDVDVKATSRVQREQIVSLDAPDGLTAGKTGRVRVRVQALQGPITERFIDVRVPAGIPEGPVQIVVAGAAEATRSERELGLVPQPTSYAGLVRMLQSAPAPGTLSVYLVREEGGVRLDGQSATGLPSSLAGLVAEGAGLSGTGQDARGVLLGRIASPAVITGEMQTKMFVRGKER